MVNHGEQQPAQSNQWQRAPSGGKNVGVMRTNAGKDINRRVRRGMRDGSEAVQRAWPVGLVHHQQQKTIRSSQPRAACTGIPVMHRRMGLVAAPVNAAVTGQLNSTNGGKVNQNNSGGHNVSTWHGKVDILMPPAAR